MIGAVIPSAMEKRCGCATNVITMCAGRAGPKRLQSVNLISPFSIPIGNANTDVEDKVLPGNLSFNFVCEGRLHNNIIAV